MVGIGVYLLRLHFAPSVIIAKRFGSRSTEVALCPQVAARQTEVNILYLVSRNANASSRLKQFKLLGNLSPTFLFVSIASHYCLYYLCHIVQYAIQLSVFASKCFDSFSNSPKLIVFIRHITQCILYFGYAVIHFSFKRQRISIRIFEFIAAVFVENSLKKL